MSGWVAIQGLERVQGLGSCHEKEKLLPTKCLHMSTKGCWHGWTTKKEVTVMENQMEKMETGSM